MNKGGRREDGSTGRRVRPPGGRKRNGDTSSCVPPVFGVVAWIWEAAFLTAVLILIVAPVVAILSLVGAAGWVKGKIRGNER